MKKECNIVRDILPLYVENMVSGDTKAFVENHLQNCSDCAAELKRLQQGEQIVQEEVPKRESDANVITTVKKKIAQKILKIVASVCLLFAALFGAVFLYTGLSYPVTQDNISLSTKTDGEYSYIVLETEAGKSLSFDSKNEDILDENNKVCGQKITLYNLRYHNNFSQSPTTISWGSSTSSENQYTELVVELEDGTLQISCGK